MIFTTRWRRTGATACASTSSGASSTARSIGSVCDGAYVRLEPDAEGVIESEEYPGLRLHVPSMLAGDRAGVLAWLR